MRHDAVLVAPLGLLGHALGHDPSAAGMVFPATDRERVGCSVHHGAVGRGLHELGSGADVVDVPEALDGVDHELVGPVADVVAVLLVGSPHVEMDIALPAMVETVCICELGEERSRVFGERMEEGQVGEFGEHLRRAPVSKAFSLAEFNTHYQDEGAGKSQYSQLDLAQLSQGRGE